MSLLVFSDTFLEGIFWDFVIALLHLFSHITMGFFLIYQKQIVCMCKINKNPNEFALKVNIICKYGCQKIYKKQLNLKRTCFD